MSIEITTQVVNQELKRITVIFLLYNAGKNVRNLVEAIQKQVHPDILEQEKWLEVIFMDDASRDNTAQVLEQELGRIGKPAHFRSIRNPQNLGLSKTLNKAFELACSPFGLTCHCDVLFGRPDYVASMLSLMEQHPKAGAITGQPQIPPASETILPFAERMNLITNLMDIFPPETGGSELVPIGFAEGRCDVFNIGALREAGFYDTALRLAGEDQVLAAKMRKKGYEIYQAPKLSYYLSVSDEQDTLGKLLKHQMLYGRAHPYILLKNRKTSLGILGKRAGANRQARTLLKALQLLATIVYCFAAIHSLFTLPYFGQDFTWVYIILGIFVAKTYLYFQHFRLVPLRPLEFLFFYCFQPFLDVSYTVGVMQGVWLTLKRSSSESIS